MPYRTKTYIAADWTGDNEAVKQLHKWNDSKYWSLSFTDAHDFTQARDSSLNCNIKTSLAKRLDVSKTFVLIVGNKTKNLKSGSCHLCDSYNSWSGACVRGYYVDYRSFIKYECEKAVRDKLKIVVLYNSIQVVRDLCPDVIKYNGNHVAMRYLFNGSYQWDYQAVKNALC